MITRTARRPVVALGGGEEDVDATGVAASSEASVSLIRISIRSCSIGLNRLVPLPNRKTLMRSLGKPNVVRVFQAIIPEETEYDNQAR